MKLSLRLQTIHDMVPSGIASDIGSDHGKLIISLFEDGIIKKGYAVENKKGPFNRLKKEIENSGYIDYITPIFADGISELPSDSDVVIIAGMGGNTIINILKAHVEKLKNVQYIIVDAHNAVKSVRKEVTALGYFILNEKIIVEDGIYYEIILFEKGHSSKFKEKDFEYGPILRKEKSMTFIAKYKTRVNEIDLLLEKELPDYRKNELIAEKQRILEIL